MGEGHGSHTARALATDIVRRLREAGFDAYFAGGCVRDRLMGHEPGDYDVATGARPDEVKQLFPGAHLVGEAFGVVLVRRDGHTVEVATFRIDGEYSDQRRPDSVVFTDARQDAFRRDFTVNGLFEDPLSGEIIDYVGGQADLKAKKIRAIGDPHARFAEDHLRMLRGIRFAARFNYEIDGETSEAIRSHAEELRGVSRERIGDEVRRMLADPNRGFAAWELQYHGLDRAALNEPNLLLPPVRVGRLAEAGSDHGTALAAWMLDRHGGTAGHIAEHELDEHVSRWRGALVLSNAVERDLRETLRVHRELRVNWEGLGVAGRKRLAAEARFEPAMHLVQTTEPQRFVDVSRSVQELKRTGLSPEPLVSGRDLIGFGCVPGPAFKRVLDRVYDAQLEGAVLTRAEALALADALFREGLEADDSGGDGT